MADKPNLYGLGLSELQALAATLGLKQFSGRQVFQWIYQKGVRDVSGMSNLSKPLRQLLSEKYRIATPRVVRTQTSQDGTHKFLLALEDGERIETVKIPERGKLTLCVSTQVGCPLGCRFCKTGQIGYRRNLTVGEIAGQMAVVRASLADLEAITNLVFMGMGEPLLNYENLKGAVSILCSELGFGLAARKITVSTAGHVPGIRRLAEDFPKLGLAISLNSAEEEVRRKLMPIARRYSLGELISAAKYYVQKTGRRMTFEYILIDGVTDTPIAAKRLVAFVGDLPCKINLIVYNTAPGLPKELQPSPPDAVTGFRDYLYPRTPALTISKSKGADILAACGQLAGAGS